MKLKLLFLSLFIFILCTPSYAQSGVIANVGPSVITYPDSTVVDGQIYNYWITSVAPNCPASPDCGESIPSNLQQVTIPTTGTHTVTLNWTKSTSTNVVSQNIYRVPPPLSPTNLAATVN
jgi:hypothetical protein